MKAWELIEETRTPDGGVMRLTHHDGEFLITVDRATLMSSRERGSEEVLAAAALRRLPATDRPRVLVGGLGMGFTLRATLERLPKHAQVTVSELVPAVIAWNRGPLGPLAGHPLHDGRVEVANEDVRLTLKRSDGRFDVILLDVDNGPSAFTSSANHGLYGPAGIAAVRKALAPEGVLAVWSAYDDRAFVQRLENHGFQASSEHVRARLSRGGPRHTIFLAVKTARTSDRPPRAAGRPARVRR